MPHDSWRGAVEAIRAATALVTSRQKQIAAVAHVELPDDMPQILAAARLQTALAMELGLSESSPVLGYQVDLLTELATDAHVATPAPTDRREADAWIEFLRLTQRRLALEQLRIEASDIVEVMRFGGGHLAEVSSITGDGTIYFKGGEGARAWPDQVQVRCRNGDVSESAAALRVEARNQAASRTRTSRWSGRRERELEAFAPTMKLSEDDVEQLRTVIDAAPDEKLIQDFIESHPQVLTAILGGHHARFCLPRVELGGEGGYVPDFLLAHANSLGIGWVLVELETPKSSLVLKSKNDLDQYVRKGISQVKEWREWLQNNLDYARRSKAADGLGLVDIRPQSDALVLVGRDDGMLAANASALRHQIRENDAIRIHTYDWLLEQLTGILRFGHAPGVNRYLLPLVDGREEEIAPSERPNLARVNAGFGPM